MPTLYYHEPIVATARLQPDRPAAVFRYDDRPLFRAAILTWTLPLEHTPEYSAFNVSLVADLVDIEALWRAHVFRLHYIETEWAWRGLSSMG